MDQYKELRARLNELGDKIDVALERLRVQHALHSAEGRSGQNLKKRYDMIQATVNQEVADLEETGHHVSALERSFLEWLEHLSFDR